MVCDRKLSRRLRARPASTALGRAGNVFEKLRMRAGRERLVGIFMESLLGDTRRWRRSSALTYLFGGKRWCEWLPNGESALDVLFRVGRNWGAMVARQLQSAQRNWLDRKGEKENLELYAAVRIAQNKKLSIKINTGQRGGFCRKGAAESVAISSFGDATGLELRGARSLFYFNRSERKKGACTSIRKAREFGARRGIYQ